MPKSPKKRRHLSDSSSGGEVKRKKKHKKEKKKKEKKHKKHKEKRGDKDQNKKTVETNDKKQQSETLVQEDVRRSMRPMTKEEWEKQQSVVRRVYDEQTGRSRLIKGDGEVLEEIVSKDRHKEINRKATLGDGNFFQSQLRLLK